jgi:hypothetical protein
VLNLPEEADADKMAGLRRKFQTPSIWQSVGVPAIAVLLVLGVFLFTTQPEVSTFLAGLGVLVTSLTTILAFARSSFGKLWVVSNQAAASFQLGWPAKTGTMVKSRLDTLGET